MDKTLNMALVGASGVVGKKILQLLEKKGIQVDKLFPLGSSTVGQTVHFLKIKITLLEVLMILIQQMQI